MLRCDVSHGARQCLACRDDGIAASIDSESVETSHSSPRRTQPGERPRVAGVSPDEKRRALLPFLDVANGILESADCILDLANSLLGLARSDVFWSPVSLPTASLTFPLASWRAFYAIFVHLKNSIQSMGRAMGPERSRRGANGR